MSCSLTRSLVKASPIISGLVAKNCPSFIKVVPMPSRASHNFSPGFFCSRTCFFLDPIENKLKKFVNTGDFTLGKELTIFEKKFANLIGTKYAVGVNSGTDAIKLSLKVLDIKPGDEVITAANTFVATVGAICELGAIPIFVDCDDSFCIDTSLIEKKITKKTKAIVPVHFTGYMTNMVKLK